IVGRDDALDRDGLADEGAARARALHIRDRVRDLGGGGARRTEAGEEECECAGRREGRETAPPCRALRGGRIGGFLHGYASPSHARPGGATRKLTPPSGGSPSGGQG